MCLQPDPPFQAKYNSGAQYRDLTDTAERLFVYFFSQLTTNAAANSTPGKVAA
jgi:hypothetical protein